MELPDSRTRTVVLIYASKKWRHYLFGMEIRTYTYRSSLAIWETNAELSGRKARWIELLCDFPVKILYPNGQLDIVADALSIQKDHRLINSLSVLENKEMTGLRQDDLFRDIAAYFCDTDEKIPLGLLSTMHLHRVPRSKLLYFIREGERRLCMPRSHELIHLVMHELHDLPFAAHPGFTKVYEDIRKLLYWAK